MRIGERQIGLNHPPYVIAEIGVNHDGEVSRALELTDAAAEAGADAVKLQYFETDRLMSKAAKLAAYQKAAGETDPISMLRRLELTLGEMALVVERAHARGIHAIVTVFSTELVDGAQTLAWDAYKTASPDLVNYPLIRRLIETGMPLILSTGAAEWTEVQFTYHDLIEPISERCAMLQCVSSYPTPRENAAIAGMLGLDHELLWRGGSFGYSDHTSDLDTGALAVRIGANMLEKHLTYNRSAVGPDHSASLEPLLFAQYVQIARGAPRDGRLDSSVEDLKHPDEALLASDPAYGPPEKRVLDCERDVREVSRQSIVAVRQITKGEIISASDLTMKRPGTGLLGSDWDNVVGMQAARAIEADRPIESDDLSGFYPSLAHRGFAKKVRGMLGIKRQDDDR